MKKLIFLLAAVAGFSQTVQTVQVRPAFQTACPSAPVLQYNELTGRIYVCIRGTGWLSLTSAPGHLFSQTQSITIQNSTVETTLVGTGDGTMVIPANYMVPGRTLLIKAYGYHSATANPNITLKFKVDSVIALNTGLVASHTSTNEVFSLEVLVTCRTAGSGGTIIAQGMYIESGSNPVSVSMTAPLAFDTTIDNTMDLTAQWGTASASNSITATNILVQ